MVLPVSNSLNVLYWWERAKEDFLWKYLAISLFISSLLVLNVKALKANNWETTKCYKTSQEYILLLIMSQNFANFVGEETWPGIFKKV